MYVPFMIARGCVSYVFVLRMYVSFKYCGGVSVLLLMGDISRCGIVPGVMCVCVVLNPNITGVCLIGVYLTVVCLSSVCLPGVCLSGVCLADELLVLVLVLVRLFVLVGCTRLSMLWLRGWKSCSS